ALWIGDRAAEHLVAAANPQHPPAAPAMRENVDVPALTAQRREIGERRLRSRQDDEVRVAGQRRSARDKRHLDRWLGTQGVEIVEIGYMRQEGYGDADR